MNGEWCGRITPIFERYLSHEYGAKKTAVWGYRASREVAWREEGEEWRPSRMEGERPLGGTCRARESGRAGQLILTISSTILSPAVWWRCRGGVVVGGWCGVRGVLWLGNCVLARYELGAAGGGGRGGVGGGGRGGRGGRASADPGAAGWCGCCVAPAVSTRPACLALVLTPVLSFRAAPPTVICSVCSYIIMRFSRPLGVLVYALIPLALYRSHLPMNLPIISRSRLYCIGELVYKLSKTTNMGSLIHFMC